MGKGPTPYGYRAIRNEKGKTVDLALNPKAAPIVERIFREAADRVLVEIASLLNAERVPSP